MLKRTLFVAGTDTGIGKTVFTGLLAKYLAGKGLSVVTQKWVQTGASPGEGDVAEHAEAMDGCGKLAEGLAGLTVPYSFRFPASPHLASAVEGKKIFPERIRECFLSLKKDFDIVLVEGTGGVLVPLTERDLAVDLVRELDLEVILVVGNRLGAINHALLSVEALRTRQVRVAGLVFNRFTQEDDDLILVDNRKIISRISGLPDLGEIPYEVCPAVRYGAFRGTGERVWERVYGR